jgi:hypothetical protein
MPKPFRQFLKKHQAELDTRIKEIWKRKGFPDMPITEGHRISWITDDPEIYKWAMSTGDLYSKPNPEKDDEDDEDEEPRCPTCDRELMHVPAEGGRIMQYTCPVCHERWDEDSEEIKANPQKLVIGHLESSKDDIHIMIKKDAVDGIRSVTLGTTEYLKIVVPKKDLRKIVRWERGVMVLGQEFKNPAEMNRTIYYPDGSLPKIGDVIIYRYMTTRGGPDGGVGKIKEIGERFGGPAIILEGEFSSRGPQGTSYHPKEQTMSMMDGGLRYNYGKQRIELPVLPKRGPHGEYETDHIDRHLRA